MADSKIILKRQELTNRITSISSISQKLSEDTLVKTLTFGESSASAGSKGEAVNAVKELNVELDNIAKKLALLNEKTSGYLESVIRTFDLADNSL